MHVCTNHCKFFRHCSVWTQSYSCTEMSHLSWCRFVRSHHCYCCTHWYLLKRRAVFNILLPTLPKTFHIPLQLLSSLANWNPFLQLHVKEPWLLAQSWAHPPLLVLHSLMSGGKQKLYMQLPSNSPKVLQACKHTATPWPCVVSLHFPLIMWNKCHSLPLHVVPLLARSNPLLHSQRKDPGSFTHWWSHPPLLLSHSLMSEQGEGRNR